MSEPKKTSNHYVEELCAALDGVARDSLLQDEWRRDPWTRAVKTALCSWGLDHGFFVCAHGVADRFRGEPKKKRPRYEWLFDVTCLTYKGNYLTGVPLVAECEWGDEAEIYDDFQKLLLARAEIRVMVFDADQIPSKDTFGKFKKAVDRFGKGQPGDTYLLAAYREEPDGFEYRLVRSP